MGTDRDSIDEIEGFRRAVDGLRRTFPSLRMHVDPDVAHPAVDAVADIPPQVGLDFGVSFQLQDRDELHLNAGTTSLRVGWFPCSDPQVVAHFTEAVTGLLSGRYRIVEHFLGEEAVKSELQQPVAGGEWETIATWRNLLSLIPWRRRLVTTQNASGHRLGSDAAGA